MRPSGYVPNSLDVHVWRNFSMHVKESVQELDTHYTDALIESNVESVNGLEGTHGAAPSSFGAVSTAHIHA